MKLTESFLLIVFVASGVAGGCGGPSEAEKPRAATPPRETPPRQESTGEGREPFVAPLEILSVLSVEREVDLLARRDGVVEEIFLDQGARVRKGTVLARLDDRELLAQLDRARANLTVSENNVKYNEAELKARQAAHRRAQEMRELGLNSDADLEEAEFRAKGAQYDLASWHAVVERTQAEIRQLELELEKTRIRAPFGGVVARRFIRPGQNVLKDDKCFRLSQLAPLQVRFLVPETAARQPRVGEAVDVVAAQDSRRVYQAKIRKVSPVVDPASGGIEVMAQLTGRDLGGLRPGMTVRVLWGEPSPTGPD